MKLEQGHPSMAKQSNYIPALDGLRAVSILLVLVFHLNESYLPGGFVGVDIFFVISGYIISRHLIKERESKSFSFKKFYWRRITRLVPAATITALITYALTSYVFGVDRAEDLTGSFATSNLWMSNIYYYFNVGYFDSISSSNPFLHYWSLSVEEQFYLIWPTIIIFLVGTKFYRYTILLLVSIGFSAFIYSVDPQAMFYLMPTRAFQFAAGALVACAHFYRQNWFDSGNVAGGAVGIASCAIIFGSAMYASGEDYNFLIAALAPTVGASAFILYVNTAPLRLTIGSSWFTWVGKRAYSIYLVHWPIMVFASFYLGPNKPFVIDVLIILACFAMADLLYHQVENPVRQFGRRFGNHSGKAVGMSVASLVVVTVSAMALSALFVQGNSPQTDIALSNSPDALQQAAGTTATPVDGSGDSEFGAGRFTQLAEQISARRYRQGRISRGCHLPYDRPFEQFLADACLPELPEGQKVMLIGDSYGAETIPLIENWLSPDRLISAVSGGCLPIYPEPGIASRPSSCQELNRYRYNALEDRDDVTAVVLVSNWRHWRPTNMESTIEYISSLGKQVFVIGARPQYSESIPELLDSPIGSKVYQDLSRYHMYDPHERNAQLEEIAGRFDGAFFINVLPSFCPDSCPAFFGDRELIYMDAAHTGPNFAQMIAEQVELNQPEVVSALRAAISQSGGSQTGANIETGAPVLDLRLECEAINENLPAATRSFRAQLINGSFSVQLGTPSDDRYEYWEGVIQADGQLVIEGEYIEGPGGIKPVHLEGRYRSGSLSASGNRGVRECSLFID